MEEGVQIKDSRTVADIFLDRQYFARGDDRHFDQKPSFTQLVRMDFRPVATSINLKNQIPTKADALFSSFFRPVDEHKII